MKTVLFFQQSSQQERRERRQRQDIVFKADVPGVQLDPPVNIGITIALNQSTEALRSAAPP